MFEYSFAEIKAMLLTLKAPANVSRGAGRKMLADDDLSAHGRGLLQSSVDWRTAGKVTPVRNQGG